jgi:1-aminocyclopropane-1-carboxylate deaminase/D-cysteine desulfhydrase-like pyridoxal-dependent ACC family enzyme
LNIDLIVKRDDMTAGVELGGNKVRKLEFLLADAIERGYDTVVTIGGEQSNHCRATAAACRMVGLKPHLILRTKRADSILKDAKEKGIDSFGQVGNIMYDRMVGATVHMCTPGEYGRFGNKALVKKVAEDLEEKYGSKVYQISVGGSSGLGTWGYIEGVHELKKQTHEQIDHIVFACGSGGTAAGITFGTGLAYQEDSDDLNLTTPKLHAIGVCDSPEYFYNEVCLIGNEMGFDISSSGLPQTSMEDFVLDHLTVHQGKGNGYALSTPEELDFVCRLASETGIVLDPGELIFSVTCVYFEYHCSQFLKFTLEKPFFNL